MKKKFDLNVKSKTNEDIKYYLDVFKQEAATKATEIFENVNEMELKAFDIKEIYKDTDNSRKRTNSKLSDIITQLKQESIQISQDIFNKND